MSRGGRYPPDDYYYDDPPPERRRRRDYEEVDVDVRERTRDGRRQQPDFLHEDYGRTDAGPLIRQRRSTSDFDHPPPRSRSRGPPPREREEEVDVNIREYDRSRRPRRYDKEEIDVDVRESRNRPPREEREILYRHGEGDRDARPRREEIDIDIRSDDDRGARMRDGSRARVEVDIREDDRRGHTARPRSRAPPLERDAEIDVTLSRQESARDAPRETIAIRERSPPRDRSRGIPRGVPIMREREEFYYRRRSPPREPPPRGETEEIAVRVRKSSPSPSPPRAPTPPPPEIIIENVTRPPIIQEVITHHRHIDHGVIRAPPSPESSPSPPPRARREDIEVDIRRKDARGNVTEEDIRIVDGGRDKRRDEERRVARVAPTPAAPRATREETTVNVNIDADFGSNGDRRIGPVIAPARPRPREMWTEVTKDLVTKEAITAMGYQYEETADFFYVMEYLRYDDIVRLVDVSDDIRYGRRERIDQIQWERQDPRFRERERERDYERERGIERRTLPAPNGWDERIHEREVVYEEVLPRRRR